MRFFVAVLLLFFVLDAVYCQSAPNNTYNVPLFDFTDNPLDKSLLCSTPKCCPIALTFDDGPDGARGATDAIVNYLHDNMIPATFFMNSHHWVDVNTDLVAQQSVRNIIQYGFDLGTHTVFHRNLADLSDADVKEEIVGVQITLNKLLSPSPHLSLFRAPFGPP
jgi:peptidoglycan/xylan/chitin deacetylase (PgdA/CDA1 family)